jgi:hypothetical protein
MSSKWRGRRGRRGRPGAAVVAGGRGGASLAKRALIRLLTGFSVMVPGGDGGVGVALGHQAQDVLFARGQVGQGVPAFRLGSAAVRESEDARLTG